MDKAEYKIKLDQINKLAEAGDFKGAAGVMDSIDWKHVKSVRTLCMVGEIYEANKRYEDSKQILKYAYKRSSVSKTVLYRLTEIDIRTGDYDEAKKYFDEFEEISPNDTSRYILKYKLLRAEGAPLDQQIAVLKEYKEHEYTERWAYELAKLYKKKGQKEKCIEECDDMILWFSEGKYVTKAMELKMQMKPLSESQQIKYDNRFIAAKRAAATAIPSDDLNGFDKVEKEVTKEDRDEDHEENAARPKVSAAEAISKMNAAAGATVTEATSESKPPNVTPDLRPSFINDSTENIQKQLADSIKAVFAGIRPSETAEDESETAGIRAKTEEAGSPVMASQDFSPAKVKELEPESISPSAIAKEKVKKAPSPAVVKTYKTAVPAADKKTEEPWGQMSLDEFMRTEPEEAQEAEKAGTEPEEEQETKAAVKPEAAVPVKSDIIDLDALFAETGNAFANEVASGNFKMADALEEASAEEAPEAEAAAAETSSDEAPAEEESAAGTEEAPEAEAAAAETSSDEVPAEEESAAGTEEAPEAEAAAEETSSDEIPAEEESAAGTEEAPEAEAAAAETPSDEVPAEEESAAGTEEAPEKAPAEDLLGKETDESLGLTREFNFHEELRKAMRRGAGIIEAAKNVSLKAEAEPVKQVISGTSAQENDSTILSPEEAAKKAVLTANGMDYIPEENKERIFDDADESDVSGFQGDTDAAGNDTEAVQSDAEVLRGDTKELPRELREELIAGVEDEKETSATIEQLTDISSVSENEIENSRSIIDHIMEKPETVKKMPLVSRRLDETEEKLFSYFSPIPGIAEQITKTIADVHNNAGDKTSKSGNILLLGRQGSGKTRLADGLILAICRDLGIQAAKTAKIVAEDFNAKDPATVVKKMSGGFLVIEGAGTLSDESVEKLSQAMEFRTDDLVVILEDEKGDLRNMLQAHPDFSNKFTSSVTIPVFTNDELVTFAKTYAKEQGYKMDEMGTLALYTMIGENQKDAEPVTVGKVKEMMDKAIGKEKSRKFGRKFSKNAVGPDGRILLREKDFNF